MRNRMDFLVYEDLQTMRIEKILRYEPLMKCMSLLLLYYISFNIFNLNCDK